MKVALVVIGLFISLTSIHAETLQGEFARREARDLDAEDKAREATRIAYLKAQVSDYAGSTIVSYDIAYKSFVMEGYKFALLTARMQNGLICQIRQSATWPLTEAKASCH